MSASSKKKLRKEMEAEKLTEKQVTAQKEAKKLSLYSTAFVVVMVVLLVVALTVGVTQTITNSGMMEKKTVALVVGDHEISNAELNYFYMDAVNTFYSQYGDYAMMFGMDPSSPLNEQIVDEASGLTWADDFLASAKATATAAYAMKDAADAAGYTLPEENLAAIDAEIGNLDIYATLYGYANADAYLKAIYGNGADAEGYANYTKLRNLADSYHNHYAESLTYDDAALREMEAENFDAYSSFTYNAYYVAASKFRTGGTTDENGSTTYSDEEIAASVEAAEEAAKALIGEEIDSVEALDAAVAAMDVNADLEASSTAYVNTLYSSVNTAYVEWIADSARQAGDKEVFANTTTSTDEDGNEVTQINGYYAVYYLDSTDNTFALANVRHILVPFAHDDSESEEHDHSDATYTEAEKSAAKATAEEILKDWKSGEATEDSFAAMANEKSADGDGTTGGLYENVYPGQMVTNFNDWCFDSSRKAGDTDIVETEYGYHVMYYSGDSDVNYRDYQITNALRTQDVNAWYDGLLADMPSELKNTKYIAMDLVLQPAA